MKALNLNEQLHHLKIYGLIDRDRRTQKEIDGLEGDSVYVLDVAEVENLFCTQEVLEIVSNKLSRDPVADFKTISNTVFQRLQEELDSQVSLRVSSEVKFRLNKFDDKQKGANDISKALQTLVNSIDVNKIYSDTYATYNEVLQNKNYKKLLTLFNRKSLSSQVSSSLGLASGSLPETVVRFAKGDSKEEIINAIKPYFGNFQQHMT